MRIKRIAVKNIRTIEDLSFNFNGCSAIVTGKNAIGKSTFLKFLFDRFSSITDKNPVWKDNEGYYELELDDDTTISYYIKKDNRNSIKEKLVIIYPDGRKERLTKDIINRLYPRPFDIDKFIQLKPKEKLYYLCDILGKDNVKDIVEQIELLKKDRETQYRIYNQKEKAIIEFRDSIVQPLYSEKEITEAKTKKEAVLNNFNNIVVEVAKHNERLDRLVNEYRLKIIEENNKNKARQKEIKFNIDNLKSKISDYEKIVNYILNTFDSVVFIKGEEMYTNNDVSLYINKKIESLEKDCSLIKIYTDEEIDEMVNKYKETLDYKKMPERPDTKEYDDILIHEKELFIYKSQLLELERLNEELKIEKERYDSISNRITELENNIRDIFASMNNDYIRFSHDGIYYKDKLVDKHKMSSSELYKSAIYIGSMCLGEIRVMVFDISTFDKDSFLEILKFAEENNIQILVEKPDWSGENKIKIEIINQ